MRLNICKMTCFLECSATIFSFFKFFFGLEKIFSYLSIGITKADFYEKARSVRGGFEINAIRCSFQDDALSIENYYYYQTLEATIFIAGLCGEGNSD